MRIKRVTTADGETLQHVESPLGVDFTLCGLTLDDDTRTIKRIEDREGRITCEHCRIIIDFCKSL